MKTFVSWMNSREKRIPFPETKKREQNQNEKGKQLSFQRFLTEYKHWTLSFKHPRLKPYEVETQKFLSSLWRTVLKAGSREPKAISEDMQSLTIFIIILRCYLPFSLPFLQECSLSFPEDM